jgi:hypothetical protein
MQMAIKERGGPVEGGGGERAVHALTRCIVVLKGISPGGFPSHCIQMQFDFPHTNKLYHGRGCLGVIFQLRYEVIEQQAGKVRQQVNFSKMYRREK